MTQQRQQEVRTLLTWILTVATGVTIPMAIGWAVHMEKQVDNLNTIAVDRAQRLSSVETSVATVGPRFDRLENKVDRVESKIDRILTRKDNDTP